MKSAIALATVAAAISLVQPTGALAQQGGSDGRMPFDSYQPTRCVVATRFIDGINRHDRPDTTRFDPRTRRDTLTSETIASIEECDEVYGGEVSDPRWLLDLARVKLFTQQDEAALAIARRHMGNMAGRPVEERAWEQYLIASDLLSARPARIEEARAALAELDKLGTAAAGVRVAVHAAMVGQAIQQYDEEWMRAEAAAVRDAWLELDDESRLWRAFPLASTAAQRAAVEAMVSGKEVALTVLDSTLGILPRSAQRERAMLEGAKRLYQLLDTKAAQIEAKYWFNTGTTGDVRPAPGRVSLILPLSRPCVGGCYNSMILGARRLQKQFEDQPFDITFRYRTYGYYLDNAPVTPLEEVRYDSTYFLHEVGLPGALAIAETQYNWLPDGRRSNQPTADDRNYRGAAVVVVDRNGIIRYVSSGWNTVQEERLTDLIAELLREPYEGTT